MHGYIAVKKSKCSQTSQTTKEKNEEHLLKAFRPTNIIRTITLGKLKQSNKN